MIGYLKLVLCFCVYFMVLNTAECQVTITNLNGTGTFLCGHSITLQCAIPGYVNVMSWNSNGILIAQCILGSCSALDAMPLGDIFYADEAAKLFNLIIGISIADNGTLYQCNDGSFQAQTTVNIQAVPPSESEFTPEITETPTSITVEAGCFYPSDVGRMDVYCVSEGTEKLLKADVIMTSTTTGCIGNCSGPDTYTATGSYAIDDSNTGGTSAYRFKVYHKDYTNFTVTKDSAAVYKCDNSTTSTSTTTTTTPTTTTTSTSTSTTTTSTKSTSTTSTPTTTATTTHTTTPTSSTTKSTRDNDISITIITSIIGGCVILLCIVALIAFLYRRFGSNVKSTKASGDNHISKSERKSKSDNNNQKSDEINKYDQLFSTRGNENWNTAGNYQYTYAEPYYDPLHTNSYSGFSSNTYHTYSSVNPHSMSIQVQNAARNIRAHRSAPSNYQPAVYTVLY